MDKGIKYALKDTETGKYVAMTLYGSIFFVEQLSDAHLFPDIETIEQWKLYRKVATLKASDHNANFEIRKVEIYDGGKYEDTREATL